MLTYTKDIDICDTVVIHFCGKIFIAGVEKINNDIITVAAATDNDDALVYSLIDITIDDIISHIPFEYSDKIDFEKVLDLNQGHQKNNTIQ